MVCQKEVRQQDWQAGRLMGGPGGGSEVRLVCQAVESSDEVAVVFFVVGVGGG